MQTRRGYRAPGEVADVGLREVEQSYKSLRQFSSCSWSDQRRSRPYSREVRDAGEQGSGVIACVCVGAFWFDGEGGEVTRMLTRQRR